MSRNLSARRPLFIAAALCCGFIITASCVKVSQNSLRADNPAGQNRAPAASSEAQAAPPRININTATLAELERLPGVGPVLAARIIAHREQYGRFRRAEHLILVRGMSDQRFRQMRNFITAE